MRVVRGIGLCACATVVWLGSCPSPLQSQEAPRQAEWHLLPVAVPAYQPETSFLLGAAAVLAQQQPSNRRESQVTLAGAVSVRKQASLLLDPDFFLCNERVHATAKLSIARFPDQFFGMGDATRGGDKEWFTPVYLELGLGPQLRLWEGGYVGPHTRLLWTDMRSVEADGQLARGDLTGADGGLSLELGLSLFWDARDNTIYPTGGGVLRAAFGSARPAWGADFAYDVWRTDGRYYLSLPWPKHILALQGLAELRRGTPPFYDTGRLGGAEILRGYYEGRFRDRQYLATQLEYRFPLVWRFGAVLFAAVGTVVPGLAELRLARLKPAAGGGLRLAPLKSVPVNIRLDVAYGNEVNFYLDVGEAF